MSFDENPDKEIVPILLRLLFESWHECHEDIVFTLQQCKDQRAVEAIQAVATVKYDYLEKWGNYYEFARKCTWALADIGGEKAKHALSVLSENKDVRLATYAKERLEKWETEIRRKGSR